MGPGNTEPTTEMKQMLSDMGGRDPCSSLSLGFLICKIIIIMFVTHEKNETILQSFQHSVEENFLPLELSCLHLYVVSFISIPHSIYPLYQSVQFNDH